MLCQYFQSLGYLFFTFAFASRLINGFKGSIFAVNKKNHSILNLSSGIALGFLIISMIFRILAVVLFLTLDYKKNINTIIQFFNLSLIILIVASLIYFMYSIYLLKLMFSKIKQFNNFINQSTTTDDTTKSSYSSQKNPSISNSVHVL